MNQLLCNKLGIKENMKCYMLNAPSDFKVEILSPTLHFKKSLSGNFDYLHFFAKNQDHFKKHFPKLKLRLKKEGMLWVSWPKGGKLNTDLTIKSVIKLGYEFGLVESKCISINLIWSALKFTWPKENKIYNNSYGSLS